MNPNVGFSVGVRVLILLTFRANVFDNRRPIRVSLNKFQPMRSKIRGSDSSCFVTHMQYVWTEQLKHAGIKIREIQVQIPADNTSFTFFLPPFIELTLVTEQVTRACCPGLLTSNYFLSASAGPRPQRRRQLWLRELPRLRVGGGAQQAQPGQVGGRREPRPGQDRQPQEASVDSGM